MWYRCLWCIGILVLTGVCVSLSSCNSAGGGGSTAPLTVSATPLSIDATSIVPVVNGAATTSKLYIRNNTNVPISGLSFSVQNTSVVGFTILSDSACTSVPANGYCTLDFTTPSLTTGGSGNSLVTLSYHYNGQDKQFTQVVNYRYVDTASGSGVNFNGSVTAIGEPGSVQHVVGYLFGSGVTDLVYDDVQLAVDPGVVAIANGFINGQQVTVGQVIAVEFTVNLVGSASSAVTIVPSYFNLQANNTQRKTTARADGNGLNIALIPAAHAAHLVFGVLPVLDLTSAAQVQTNVINDGTADSQALTVSSDNNAVTISNSCSQLTLKAYTENNCSVSYSVNTTQPGSATINYAVDGVAVASDSLVWTNDGLAPVLSITPSTNNVSTNKNTLVPVDFTVTNLGTAALPQVSFVASSGQFINIATTCDSDPTESSKYYINADTVCDVTGDFSAGDSSGSGVFNLAATGIYNGHNYNFQSSNVSYQVLASSNLVFTHPSIGQSVTLNILNQSESTRYIFSVRNSGDDPAIITSYALQNPTSSNPPVIDTKSAATTCGQNTTLAAGKSCSIDVVYGNMPSPIPISMESGSIALNINYHGGEPDVTQFLASDINYSLNTSPVQLNVSSNLSGDGSDLSPYRASGGVSSPQNVTLTYTNASASSLDEFSVDTSTIPLGLVIDPASTCKTGSETSTLVSGTNCLMILDIDQTELDDQGSSITFGSPITYPSTSWTNNGVHSTQYLVDGTGNFGFYLYYQQANIVATLSNNDGSFSTTTLNITASNLGSDSSLPVHISSVNTWLTTAPTTSGDCKVNGDFSVDCNVQDAAIGIPASIVYTMPDNVPSGDSLVVPLNLTIDGGLHAFLNPRSIDINYYSPIIANYAYVLSTAGEIIECALDPSNVWLHCTNLGTLLGSGLNLSGLTAANNYLYVTNYFLAESPLSRCNINSDGGLTGCISTSLPGIDSSALGGVNGIVVANINGVNYAYLTDHDTNSILRCVLGTDSVITGDCTYLNNYGIIESPAAIAYADAHLYITHDVSMPRLYICTLDINSETSDCSYWDVSGAAPGGITATSQHVYLPDEHQVINIFDVVSGIDLQNFGWWFYWGDNYWLQDGVFGITNANGSWFAVSNNQMVGPIANNCSLENGSCGINQNIVQLPTLNNVTAITVAPKPN